MSFKSNKIKDKRALKRQLQHYTLLASLIGASASFVTPAHAVEFFKDNFERTSLDKSIGYGSGQTQDQMNNWDYYRTTRAWIAGPNGIELQSNGLDGFNAKSGKYRVELDTNVNSSMSTKVNLVNGKNYRFKFSYRSRPKTTTTTTNQWKCTFFIFCSWVPVTTTSTTYVGGGVAANISSPSYTTPSWSVGDVASWTDSSNTFTWLGATGEATINMAATGPSDAIGTVIDDVILETTIAGSTPTVSQAESLDGILPPHVPGLTSNDSSRSDIVTPIVVDKKAAIALGKALFWDQAVGSDQQACASCHFSAGADNRIKNQIDPGMNHANAASRFTFENTLTGSKSGPNYTLTSGDFPFNPTVDDVSSSQGTFSGQFQTSPNGSNIDDCSRAVDSIFHVNGVGTRNVEPRNTPTVIDAAFNHRNFWDGRANNEFNGVSPFGRRDTAAGVIINTSSGLVKQKLKLRNASLASQAVGPVGSDFEMACRARQFADVGRKLLNRKPLALQTISASDSVLSALPTLIGTGGTYANLVQKAFAPAYWNGACGTSCGAPSIGVTPGAAYSHMEANFSLYFGLAVQMYEETLISNDTKFDKWKRGLAFPTAEESRGESVFNGKGKCSSCHKGPTMTSAAILQKYSENVIQGMLMQNSAKAVYDEGFYNTAVVPTEHDLGNGGVDPVNNPLSFAKQYLSSNFVDSFGYDSCTFEEASADLCSSNDSSAAKASFRAAVNGAFKTSSLRNITLTGPYMHNGSMSTLEQVVDFYNRGGNFGTSTNPDKHPDIQPLGLSAQEKSDLVAFMKTFTDDRVAYERAPFDHPSLTIPNGHTGNQNSVTAGNTLLAAFGVDEFRVIPAVGSGGASQKLPTFDTVLPQSPLVTSPVYGTAYPNTSFSDPAKIGQPLTGFTIRYGWSVDAIQGITAAGVLPYHGGIGGNISTINLPAGQWFVRVYGITGVGGYNGNTVASLSLVTNTGAVYGPYGANLLTGVTQNFDFTVPAFKKIYGFAGSNGSLLNTIGVIYGQ